MSLSKETNASIFVLYIDGVKEQVPSHIRPYFSSVEHQ